MASTTAVAIAPSIAPARFFAGNNTSDVTISSSPLQAWFDRTVEASAAVALAASIATSSSAFQSVIAIAARRCDAIAIEAFHEATRRSSDTGSASSWVLQQNATSTAVVVGIRSFSGTHYADGRSGGALAFLPVSISSDAANPLGPWGFNVVVVGAIAVLQLVAMFVVVAVKAAAARSRGVDDDVKGPECREEGDAKGGPVMWRVAQQAVRFPALTGQALNVCLFGLVQQSVQMLALQPSDAGTTTAAVVTLVLALVYVFTLHRIGAAADYAAAASMQLPSSLSTDSTPESLPESAPLRRSAMVLPSAPPVLAAAPPVPPPVRWIPLVPGGAVYAHLMWKSAAPLAMLVPAGFWARPYADAPRLTPSPQIVTTGSPEAGDGKTLLHTTLPGQFLTETTKHSHEKGPWRQQQDARTTTAAHTSTTLLISPSIRAATAPGGIDSDAGRHLPFNRLKKLALRGGARGDLPEEGTTARRRAISQFFGNRMRQQQQQQQQQQQNRLKEEQQQHGSLAFERTCAVTPEFAAQLGNGRNVDVESASATDSTVVVVVHSAMSSEPEAEVAESSACTQAGVHEGTSALDSEPPPSSRDDVLAESTDARGGFAAVLVALFDVPCCWSRSSVSHDHQEKMTPPSILDDEGGGAAQLAAVMSPLAFASAFGWVFRDARPGHAWWVAALVALRTIVLAVLTTPALATQFSMHICQATIGLVIVTCVACAAPVVVLRPYRYAHTTVLDLSSSAVSVLLALFSLFSATNDSILRVSGILTIVTAVLAGVSIIVTAAAAFYAVKIEGALQTCDRGAQSSSGTQQPSLLPPADVTSEPRVDECGGRTVATDGTLDRHSKGKSGNHQGPGFTPSTGEGVSNGDAESPPWLALSPVATLTFALRGRSGGAGAIASGGGIGRRFANGAAESNDSGYHGSRLEKNPLKPTTTTTALAAAAAVRERTTVLHLDSLSPRSGTLQLTPMGSESSAGSPLGLAARRFSSMVQASSRFPLASSRSVPQRRHTAFSETLKLKEQAARAEEEGHSSVLFVEADDDAPAAVSSSSKAEPLAAAGDDDSSCNQGSPCCQQPDVATEGRVGRGARAPSLRLSVPSVVPLSPEFVCLKVGMGQEDGPASLAVVDVAMTPPSLDVF
jgi:hypothetical protein